MHIILMVVFASTLGSRAAEFWPYYLTKDKAEIHVIAATEAAKDLLVKDNAVEILIALTYVESRFDPTATSRMEGTKRVVGSWPSRAQAGHGPWFCGLLQTRAFNDWNKCLEMRDISRGYKEGVAELNYWLKKTNGNIVQALNGHQCGNIGPTTACGGRGYGTFVVNLAQKLKIKPNS